MTQHLVLSPENGLCLMCFKDWLFNSPEGKEYIKSISIKTTNKAIKTEKKAIKQRKKDIKQKSYYEKKLQSIINSIVRLIDIDKGCISCEHGWDGNWTRQRHAGHRLSVGAFPELRYNLLDIFVHSSQSIL